MLGLGGRYVDMSDDREEGEIWLPRMKAVVNAKMRKKWKKISETKDSGTKGNDLILPSQE